MNDRKRDGREAADAHAQIGGATVHSGVPTRVPADDVGRGRGLYDGGRLSETEFKR